MPFIISFRHVPLADTTSVTVTTPGTVGQRTVFENGAIVADLPDDLLCRLAGAGEDRVLYLAHVNNTPGFDAHVNGNPLGSNPRALGVPVSNYPGVMPGELRTLAAAAVLNTALQLYATPRTAS